MPDFANHHTSVVVNAPVHQVYAIFSHFNDFSKFMSFVKEVTYYDEQRSHWVADVAGRHEWDAVNENWIPDRQIGWHSTSGLENFGKVTFTSAGHNQTRIDAYISYNPPAGVLGDLGESLGVGNSFETKLQEDLTHFARMVDQAPVGALDPMSSNYLFHEQSAAAQGSTTDRQNESMRNDPQRMIQEKETHRPTTDQDITGLSGSDLRKHHCGTGSTTGVPTSQLPPYAKEQSPGY